MKHVGNLDVKGVIVGSSASISSINAIQAISAGTQSATSGNVVFSNSNSVTFGMNAGTITASISGGGGGTVTVSEYPGLFHFQSRLFPSGGTFTTDAGGSTTTSLWATVVPYALPVNVAHSRVDGAYSRSVANGALQSLSWGFMYGLYTQTGDSLSLYTSYVFGGFETMNGNSCTMSTFTVASSNTVTISTAAYADIFESHRWIPLETNAGKTLPTDNYYMAYCFTSSRSVTGGAGSVNYAFMKATVSVSTPAPPGTEWIPVRTFPQSHFTAFLPPSRNVGQFGTTSAGGASAVFCLPNAIETSVLTTSNQTIQVQMQPPAIHWRLS